MKKHVAATMTAAMVVGGAMGAAGNRAMSGDQIKDNTVDSSEVQKDSLAARDLAVDSVGSSELAPNSVNSSSIQDGQVQANDIAPGSVGLKQIDREVVASLVQDQIDHGVDRAGQMVATFTQRDWAFAGEAQNHLVTLDVTLADGTEPALAELQVSGRTMATCVVVPVEVAGRTVGSCSATAVVVGGGNFAVKVTGNQQVSTATTFYLAG